MEIREAHPEEYDAAGALTVAAYRAAGFIDDDSEYADELADAARRAQTTTLLVAVEGDRLVGTGTVVTSPDSPYAELLTLGEAELRMLAVDPEVQRGGIGRALVEASLGVARTAGCRRVVLSSRRDMHVAHRLYERLGFAREPALDWEPLPGFPLMGYALDL